MTGTCDAFASCAVVSEPGSALPAATRMAHENTNFNKVEPFIDWNPLESVF